MDRKTKFWRELVLSFRVHASFKELLILAKAIKRMDCLSWWRDVYTTAAHGSAIRISQNYGRAPMKLRLTEYLSVGSLLQLPNGNVTKDCSLIVSLNTPTLFFVMLLLFLPVGFQTWPPCLGCHLAAGSRTLKSGWDATTLSAGLPPVATLYWNLRWNIDSYKIQCDSRCP